MIVDLYYANGDTAPSIMFALKDNDQQPIPITDATVYAKIRKDGTSVNTNDADNTCTIVDGPNGLARYDLASSDFPTAGKYYIQIIVVLQTGRVFTNKRNVEVSVKEKF
jgi:hypothetical protein